MHAIPRAWWLDLLTLGEQLLDSFLFEAMVPSRYFGRARIATFGFGVPAYVGTIISVDLTMGTPGCLSRNR